MPIPYLAARSGGVGTGNAFGSSVGWVNPPGSANGDLLLQILVAQTVSFGGGIATPAVKKGGAPTGDWTLLEAGTTVPPAGSFSPPLNVSVWARTRDGTEDTAAYTWEYGPDIRILWNNDAWREVHPSDPVPQSSSQVNLGTFLAPAGGCPGFASTEHSSVLLALVGMSDDDDIQGQVHVTDPPEDFDFVYGASFLNLGIGAEEILKPGVGPTGNLQVDDATYHNVSVLLELRGTGAELHVARGGGTDFSALGGGDVVSDAFLTDGGGLDAPALTTEGTVAIDFSLTDGGALDAPELGGGSVREVTAGSVDPTVYSPGSIGEQEANQAQQDAANEAGVDVDQAAPVSSAGLPELEVFAYFPDQDGHERRLFQYSNLEVVHPWCDSRTCRFTAPIFDTKAVGESNVSYFRESGYTWIKVLYRNRLIFNGPIIRPRFDFEAGTVEVNAHDPTFYLKRHFVHSWDKELLRNNGKLPVSAASMWKLVEAAFTDEDGNSFRLPGFTRGHLSSLPALANSYIEVQLGMSLWELLLQMAELADGPDFDFKPIDQRHPGRGWESYGDRGQATAEFRAFLSVNDDGKFDGIGSDKTDKVVFHYGWGRGNLKNFIYEPDAEPLTTRVTASPSKGKREMGLTFGSEQGYGILERWDEPDQGYSTEAKRRLWIESQLAAYSRPLEGFTIEPHWDQGLMGSAYATPWRYPTGYTVGDRIRAVAKKGNDFDEVFTVDARGRVMEVRLTQQNAVENVKATIDIIPEASTDVAVSYGPA